MTALAFVAHAFGGVEDLGLPLPLLLLAGGGALVGTAALLSLRAARGAQRSPPTGVLAPRGLTASVDGRAGRVLVRAAGVAVFVGIALVATLGPVSAAANPADLLLVGVFWTLLTLASLAAGPVWRRMNPLRAAAAGLARLAGHAPSAALPTRVGVWPATASLAVFVWLQALDSPPWAVLAFLLAYAVVHTAAALRYGPAWFSAGDGFEVWSDLVGRCAPLGRDEHGDLWLRSPRSALAGMGAPAGLAALVGVLVGADLFDAVAETARWQQVGLGRVGGVGPVWQTAGLLGCAGIAVAVAVGVTRRRPFLRPALVPVAVGYALAHHLGAVVFDAQLALLQLGDLLGVPLVRSVDPEPVSSALAAGVQLGVLAAGHLGAVVVAQDRAVARYDLRHARALQLPLRLALIVSLLVGIAVRFAVPPA